MSLAQHTTSSDLWTTHARACVDHKSDAVDDVATRDQHNKRGDASDRLVGTTNQQQIEVMEFELIVAENDDNIICRRFQRL